MILKVITFLAMLMTAINCFSNSLEGHWKGICVENKDSNGNILNSSIFSYNFLRLNKNKIGILEQTEEAFADNDCSIGRQISIGEISYTIGKPSSEGIYPLNIIINIDEDKPIILYDIAKVVKKDEDTDQLFLGKSYSTDEKKRPTKLSEKNRIFSKVETINQNKFSF